MDHDVELLRQYADTGSHDAFAAIVRRHVDMVYAAARRQSGGDAEVAEEVAQRVFVLLATKAKTLARDDHVLLGGWLYNAVRFVARDFQRSEQRRAKHEQRAAVAAMARHMSDANHTNVSTRDGDDAWTSAEEGLDEAMSDLGEQTRGLLVLRYFQGKTAREVGSILGISEEAARKRVSRAVEELREIFARRGVAISTTGLASALAATAALKAPAHLAAAAASAATSTAATASTVSGTALKGWAAIMAMSKAQSVVVSIVATLLVGGAIVVGGAKAIQLLTTRKPGAIVSSAASSASPAIAGPTISGVVRGPDGQPLAGAECVVGTGENQAYAYPNGGRRRRDANATVSDNAGKFVLPKLDGNYAVMIRSPKGYAEVSGKLLESTGTNVTLRPWARIEGVAKVGSKPLANTSIHLWRVGRNDEPIHHDTSVKTDGAGRFVFPQVAPGEVCVYRRLPNYRSAQWRYVQVEPGQTANVQIGGSGRSVVGRIDVPGELQQVILWTTEGRNTYEASVRCTDLPEGDKPKHAPDESIEEYWTKELAFGKTPQGKLVKEWQFGSEFLVEFDGSFRIDDLPPGKYTVTVRSFETDDEVRFSEDVARTEMTFEVPTDAPSDAPPIDIGVGTPKLLPRLRPGQAAPDFTVTTIDGQTWKLADHRGKPFVLLLWGAYGGGGGDRKEEMSGFTELARRWGKDDRIAILGSFVAPDVDQAKKVIAKYRMDFPHTADSSLMGLYDCSWPSAVVVGADGKILQKHLNSKLLEQYVERAVAEAATTTQPTSR